MCWEGFSRDPSPVNGAASWGSAPLCVPPRALRLGYLTQEMIDGYEPLLMFTIPRLAIIRWVLGPGGQLGAPHPVPAPSPLWGARVLGYGGSRPLT